MEKVHRGGQGDFEKGNDFSHRENDIELLRLFYVAFQRRAGFLWHTTFAIHRWNDAKYSFTECQVVT